MYKVIFSIFVSAIVLVLVSSHSGAFNADNLSVPRRVTVPEIIRHDTGTLHTASFMRPDGQLSLTLWSSDDAASRAANAELAAKARRDPSLTHIGVNVDESPAMFHEILRRDKLDGDSLQLHVSGDEASRLLSSVGYTTAFQ